MSVKHCILLSPGTENAITYLFEKTLSVLCVEPRRLVFQRRSYIWGMGVEDIDLLPISELQALVALGNGLSNLFGLKSPFEVLHADHNLGID